MTDADISLGTLNSNNNIDTLEHTPTWAVGVVCIIIVLASLLLELGLKALDRYFERTQQKPLQETLEKMKEDVMLLGFISLMLVITRDSLAKICMPNVLSEYMLPCSNAAGAPGFPSPPIGPLGKCKLGEIPLMSTESLHQLHMFIFVMAIVHVCYSCMTMVLARLQMKGWKHWEDECKEQNVLGDAVKVHRQYSFVVDRVGNPWTSAAGLSWIDSFFRQFCSPVKKSDYLTLRLGFIKNHNAGPTFNFLNYMTRTMEDDFKTIVGMRAYLWVFVIIFMLLNIHGWYTYFWIVFFPFVLLLAVGTKLKHVVTSLALEIVNSKGVVGVSVKPRDELFWFNKPRFMLHLIHFILFQNSFELAYFSWIWSTYGLHSCFMEKRGFVYGRVALGFASQILCSYTTLPLYVLVTQMGSSYTKAIFSPPLTKCLQAWHHKAKQKHKKRATEDKKNTSEKCFVPSATSNTDIDLLPQIGTSDSSTIRKASIQENGSTAKAQVHMNSSQVPGPETISEGEKMTLSGQSGVDSPEHTSITIESQECGSTQDHLRYTVNHEDERHPQTHIYL